MVSLIGKVVCVNQVVVARVFLFALKNIEFLFVLLCLGLSHTVKPQLSTFETGAVTEFNRRYIFLFKIPSV